VTTDHFHYSIYMVN